MKKIIEFTILLISGLFLISFQAQALTISPAKIILSANPGETLETRMSVRNDSEQTLVFFPTFDKYTTRGGEEPVFAPADFGLPTWIEAVPSKLTLKQNESGNVRILIKVPADAEPGGHYAAIFWSAEPPKGEGTGVGIVTRVGALVLLDISGEVTESGQVVDFKSSQKLYTHLPVRFSYDLKNTGSVHLGPEGKIIIKNIFGKTVASLVANPAQAYVLPGDSRTFSAQIWESEGGTPKIDDKGFFSEFKKEAVGFALGYYRANLALEYGRVTKTAKASYGFWVLPWQILIFIILLLGAVYLILTKGLRKYNQWVIERARVEGKFQDKK